VVKGPAIGSCFSIALWSGSGTRSRAESERAVAIFFSLRCRYGLKACPADAIFSPSGLRDLSRDRLGTTQQ